MPRREEILSNMRQALQIQDPEWDISPGTPEFKILEAVANQLEGVSRDGLLSTYHFDIDKKAGIELDMFLSLWGFYRIKGQRATGQVTFKRATTATSNVSIPVGTQVSVSSVNGSPTLYFSTVVNAMLSEGNTEVTVPIEAVTAGLVGNVGAYRINGFATNLPGITEVYNSAPITGGSNSESDEAFRERFRRTFMRNIAGTENQFSAVAFQESSFVNRANVISAVERYSEQIQLPAVLDATTSTPYIIDGSFSGTSLTLTVDEIDANNFPNGTFFVAATDGATINSLHKFTRGATTNNSVEFAITPAFGTANVSTQLKVVFPTSAKDSKYVYPEGGEVVGVGIGSDNEIIARGNSQDYEMITLGNNWDLATAAECSLPVFYFTPSGITRLGGFNTIIDISYEYTPSSSRNNPVINKLNKLDVFVDGTDSQIVQEQINMPQTNSDVFGNTVGPAADDFIREDGVTKPQNGHLFTLLGRSPITELGSEITVQRFISTAPTQTADPKYNLENATTYQRDEDYWLVRKTKDSDVLENLRGSQRAIEGIEWKTPLYWDNTYIFPRKGALENSIDLAAPFEVTNLSDGNLNGWYGYVMSWEVEGQESLPSGVVTLDASDEKNLVWCNDYHSSYPGPYADDPDKDSKVIYRRFYRTKAAATEEEAKLGPFYLVNIVRNNSPVAEWIDNKSDDDLGLLQPAKVPPPHGAPLNLNYYYNSLIERLDAQMESVRLVGQDVLSHVADLIPIKFNLAVVLVPNVSIVTAKSSIQSAITAFINRKQFAGDLQIADLFTAIESVPEVDNVRLLTSTEANNEIQEINVTSNSTFGTGDTITFTVDGYSTSSLQINEESYIIREALESLPSFNEGDTYAAPLVNTLTIDGGPSQTPETELFVQGNQNALRIFNLFNQYASEDMPMYLQITQFGTNNTSKDEIVKVIDASKEYFDNVESIMVDEYSISNRVATLITASAHGFQVGDSITISNVNALINSDPDNDNVAEFVYTILSVTDTTLSFAVATNTTVNQTAAPNNAEITQYIDGNSETAFRVKFVVERAQLGSGLYNYGEDVTNVDSVAWIHLLGDIAVAKQTSNNAATFVLTFLPNIFNQTDNWGHRSTIDSDGNARISATTDGNVISSGLIVRSKGSGYGLEVLASNKQTVLARYNEDLYFVSSELPVFGGLDMSVRARNTF